jgi:hypothetical protein
MWATLAIASALSLVPTQGGKLKIENDRLSYGILGQERKDNKLLAGDVFVINFDIIGLQVRDDGKVRYSMGFELINNKTKKPEFTRAPEELEATNHLGGARLPAFALSEIGTETEPGNYTMNVNITDLADKNKPTVTLTREFQVLKKEFGFVRASLTSLPESREDHGMPVPPLFVPGQTCLLNFALVGFETDAKTMQPDLKVEMRILDPDGKPTLTNPFTSEANKNIPKDFTKFFPMQFFLAANRSGKFTIELSAEDKLGKKKAKQTLSITVMEVPK